MRRIGRILADDGFKDPDEDVWDSIAIRDLKGFGNP